MYKKSAARSRALFINGRAEKTRRLLDTLPRGRRAVVIVPTDERRRQVTATMQIISPADVAATRWVVWVVRKMADFDELKGSVLYRDARVVTDPMFYDLAAPSVSVAVSAIDQNIKKR